MDYQGVLGRFTYDNGTDIRNRISAVEAGDYREIGILSTRSSCGR